MAVEVFEAFSTAAARRSRRRAAEHRYVGVSNDTEVQAKRSRLQQQCDCRVVTDAGYVPYHDAPSVCVGQAVDM